MDETKRKKHVRDPPSVPFIWELKPGIPKKDWKPEFSSVSILPKTPLKLIASVPFVWEEKPGKPLPIFSHAMPPKPDKVIIHVASSSGYSIACNYGHDHKHNDESYNKDSGSITTTTSLDLEAFSFDADESFSSAPSLLANSLVSSEKNSLRKHSCEQLETPSSPTFSETENSTSSYATGRSSPIGATFLECLFPLYPPESGFLEKDEHLETLSSRAPEQQGKDFDHEDYGSEVVRRPPTLGELIMMSRRSCRRKAIQMNPPKKTTRTQAVGCFTAVTSSNMMAGLLKRKYLPRLKLI